MIRRTLIAVALALVAAGPLSALEFEKLPLVNSIYCQALTEDGKFLVLGHRAEDSISIMDMATFKVVKEVDCRQPIAILCRGDRVLVANYVEDGTISVFSRKEDWEQVDEVEVGQPHPQLMSAPGGSYFKGAVIVKCRGDERYNMPIMAVDVIKDRHAEIDNGRLSAGTVDYKGRYYFTQGGSGSPSRAIGGVLDFAALSQGRRVEVAGRNGNSLPYLYQVSEGPFWFGGPNVFKGMPPQAVGDTYGHVLIPDRMAPLCYAFDQNYITCMKLDGTMTEIAKLEITWPERIQRAPSEGPLYTTDRSSQDHKHVAFTTGGRFHCFLWSASEQCDYYATADGFDASQGGAVAADDGDGPAGSPAKFPPRVAVGQKIEYRLVPEGTPGEFHVIDAPDGVRISEDGWLTWSPTRSDMGVQRIKIRMIVRGSSKFVRFSTEVVKPTSGERMATTTTPETEATATTPKAGNGTAAKPDVTKHEARNQAINWIKQNNASGPDTQIVSDATRQIDEQVLAGKGFTMILGAQLTKSGKPAMVCIASDEFFVAELPSEMANNLGVPANQVSFRPAAAANLRRISPPIYYIGRLAINNATTLPGNAPIAGEVQYKRAREVRATYSLRIQFSDSENTVTRTLDLGNDFVTATEITKLPFDFGAVTTDGPGFVGPTMIFMDVVGYRTADRSGTPVIVSNTLAMPINVAPPGAMAAATPPAAGAMPRADAIAVITKFSGEIEYEDEDTTKPVIYVDFDYNKLDDAAMAQVGPALKSLPKLASVNLCTDKITGVGMEHLRGMTQLKEMWGVKKSDEMMPAIATLTGLEEMGGEFEEVSDEGLKHISSLTNLTSLDLMDSQITDAGLEYLAPLKNVESLDLSRTNVTGTGLAHLQGMTGLADLDLGGTKVTDAGLAGLKGMDSLLWLNLNRTGITDAGLAQLKTVAPQLETIELNETAVTGSGLKGLGALESVTATESSFNDDGLEAIQECKSLDSLNLDATKVTDAGLVHLKGLTSLFNLSLSETAVTDAGLVHLKDMTDLIHLYLSGSKVTDAGVAHMAGMSNISVLQLSETKVTGTGLVHLKNLKDITELNLEKTALTDAGLAFVKALSPSDTYFLYLSDTQITDAGLAHFAEVNNIYSLDLSGTKITDAGLVHLKRMSKLESLSLYDTKITDAAIAALKKALPECDIDK